MSSLVKHAFRTLQLSELQFVLISTSVQRAYFNVVK